MSFRPTDADSRHLRGHVFVDETKSRDYIIAAATLLPGDVVEARKQLRRLLLPGQQRIHFVAEKDARRNQILEVMSGLDAQVTVYLAETKKAHHGRTACLHALMDDVIKQQTRMLVLERDETLMKSDLRLISERLFTVADKPTYRHETPNAEPLLWISDAVAWCQQRGGHWRAACDRLVVERRVVEL